MATEATDLTKATRARQLARTGQAKRIREAAEASHRDIGLEVGVSPSTVYRWENGLTRPSREHALRWERALARLVEELGW